MAEAHLKHWQKSNPKVLLKINQLVQSAIQTPESGVGHPEQLTGQLSGAWSRRITAKDRLAYYVEGDTLVITQVRFHYERN
jgi:toxin YoeB